MSTQSSGMAILLKSLGINPEEIKASIDQFMTGQRALLERINENQIRLEATAARTDTAVATLANKLQQIFDIAGSTVEIGGPNGEATGVLVTTEKFPQGMLDDVAAEPSRK